jgi:hypothetical protein
MMKQDGGHFSVVSAVAPVKDHSLSRDPIDVGRLYDHGAIGGDGAPGVTVSEYKNDIRMWFCPQRHGPEIGNKTYETNKRP